MGTISIFGLGKAYREYRHPTLRLLEWLGGRPRHRLNWILQDINLHVAAGESVGIVGRNGAGKSTLLKLVTGVAAPTCGELAVSGRVAALLELGMGFHPDFTGRQNVFMQGYMQGLSHAEIEALMPEVCAFAEIGEYIDRPVRIYSSGMQVRLAFSVATAVRPDILIVDEAMAVGDIYFQHKCFKRIRAFRNSGTTLLLVSHDPSAIRSMCERAVLLDGGRVAMDGNAAEVLDYYNAVVAADESDRAIRSAAGEDGGIRAGSGAVTFESVDFRTGGQSTRALQSGAPASLHLRLTGHRALEEFTVGMLIKDRLGNDVYGVNTFYLGRECGPIAPGEAREVVFTFPSLALGSGHYSLTVAAHASSDHLAGNHDWVERALVFQVVPAEGFHSIGACYMPVQCHVENDARREAE